VPRVCAVTGGSGFVGARVISVLEDRGIETISLDKRPRNSERDGTRSIVGDITDPSTFDIPEISSMVHCAGILESSHMSEDIMNSVNFEGTRNVYMKGLDAGMERFVFLSTIMVNGPRGTRDRAMIETDEPCPIEPYGRSKLDAERFLLERSEKDGVGLVILRPPVIYGEGMSPNSSAMRTFISIRKGIMPLIDGGIHRFNMLYIGNLAEAIDKALGLGCPAGVYHINEGPYDLSMVIDAIKKRMGLKRGHIYLPRPVFFILCTVSEIASPLINGPPPLSKTKYIALTTDAWNFDSKLFVESSGFEPPFSLEEGIDRTCSFYGW